MKKVFIDDQGLWYKALTARSTSHAERPVINKDFLDALPDDGSGMHLVDIDAKIAAMKAARGE